MKKTAKKYFIPHEENNYHPHILHTKRTLFYGVSMIVIKVIVVVFALLLPVQSFMTPDILEQQKQGILKQVNEIRESNGRASLVVHSKLDNSASLKTFDMIDNNYFDHIGPNDHDAQYFLKKADYNYAIAGENLAMGFVDAQEVIEAWEKSTAHYSNIIDSDFNDTGVGIAPGEYKGIPTIFITQHFGKEKIAPPPVVEVVEEMQEDIPEENIALVPTLEINVTPVQELVAQSVESVEPVVLSDRLAIEEEKVGERIAVRKEVSFVDWEELGRKSTQFLATVYIVGDIEKARISIQDDHIELTPSEKLENHYTGTLIVNKSTDDIFKVITLPTLELIDKNNNLYTYTIDWNRVKVVIPDPIEKYTQSKALLSGTTKVFSFSKAIYGTFFLLFAIALILSVFIEIRKQHPRVIAQTALLVAMIAVLFVV